MDEQDRPQPMTEEVPSSPPADGEAATTARAQDLPAGEPAPDDAPAAGGESPAAEAAQPDPAPLDAVLDAPETTAAPATPAAPAADEPAATSEASAAPEPSAGSGTDAPGEPPEVAAAPEPAEAPVAAETEDAPPAAPAEAIALAEDADAAAAGDGAPAAGDDGAEDRPRIGPKILTDFVPRPIDAPAPLPPSRASRPQPERPKRRRVTAAQRHRNVFFQRLNELRRTGRPPQEDAEAAAADGGAPENAPVDDAAPVDDVAETPAEQAEPVEVVAEAPAEQTEQAEPVAEPAPPTAHPEPEAVPAGGEEGPPSEDEQQQPAPPQQSRPRTPPPPIDRPRLIAAVERVGGDEIVREALKPKRDEEDQPVKWAVVCADASRGLKPGDPVYTAWLRLAATPVSAIKDAVGVEDERRGRRRGPAGGRRPDGRGDERRGPRGGDRGDRVSRDDLARLGSGGRVGANIRIIGADDDDKKAREQRRKEQREAKRQAERERLARLGY